VLLHWITECNLTRSWGEFSYLISFLTQRYRWYFHAKAWVKPTPSGAWPCVEGVPSTAAFSLLDRYPMYLGFSTVADDNRNHARFAKWSKRGLGVGSGFGNLKKPREFFAIVLEYEEIPQIQHTLIFPIFLACSKPENFVINMVVVCYRWKA